MPPWSTSPRSRPTSPVRLLFFKLLKKTTVLPLVSRYISLFHPSTVSCDFGFKVIKSAYVITVRVIENTTEYNFVSLNENSVEVDYFSGKLFFNVKEHLDAAFFGESHHVVKIAVL
jgi:hypothetical protein